MSRVSAFLNQSQGQQPQLLTADYAQRSKYLADALAKLQDQSTQIQSPWELAARLGADAILEHKRRKNDTALSSSLASDKAARVASILGQLGMTGDGMPSAPSAPAAPVAEAPPAFSGPTAPIGKIETTPLPPPGNNAMADALSPPNRSDGSSALGIRNNNPGNIRATSIPWQGKGSPNGGFETFSDPIQGLRAMSRNLTTHAGRGANTITQQVSQWAPPSENNTAAYIADVAKQTGLDPNATLNFQDPAVMQKIMGAMIGHENGSMPYTPQQLAQGIAAANGGQAPQMAQQAPPMAPPQQMAQPPSMQPQALPQPPQQAMQQQPQMGQPLGPTPQEKAYILNGLQSNDPAEFAAAQAYAQKIQERMMAPMKYDTQNINGVPTWTDPYHPGAMQTGAVPQAAMSRPGGGQEAQGLTPGTAFDVSPTGQRSVLQSPPQGYQGAGGSMGPVQNGPADPTGRGNIIAGEQSLRREYSPLVQEYNAARLGYQKVLAAAKDSTPASDIALIFGYMKTLDPTSTVREGEAASVQNSGSIPQNIQAMYNKAISGDRLLPEKRVEFAQAAEKQFRQYEERAKALNQQYEGLARSYGYDPSRIVQPLQPVVPYGGPQATPQAAPAGPIDPATVRWH